SLLSPLTSAHTTSFLFSFPDPATTEISTLSLHDALPIYRVIQAPDATHQGNAAITQGIKLGEPAGLEARGHHQHIRAASMRHPGDRKSTRLNSSHVKISYAVFCLKKKIININALDRRIHR